ncbi:MAG: NADH-quinone oxidoreductase subunit H [Sulfurimonas sp.]|jgi:NADH-quinone oxidoreductase subunit H|uniref:respiratory chain complex I subunit 1 family protein n=1 Tax=Sulfurimonas sp. TaxID=2022749 RepID=UPI0039E56668
MIVLDSLLMFIIAYLTGFLYYGLYRNITARFQKRFGPPVWQSFFDSIKFFTKDNSTSHGWMFYLGPVIMMSGAIMTLLFIPFFSTGDSFKGLSDYGNLFIVLYLIVLGPLGNALGVGTAGNPFGVMGVTRGLSRLLALELPFYIAVIAIMSLSSSSDIATISSSQVTFNAVAYPLLFIGALFSFIGMMGQSPFDVVGAPVEVYSGPASEFSGKFLALLMSQGAIFTFAKLVLMVHLFLGGADGFLELLMKTFGLFIIVIAFGSIYGRFKTPQSIDFLLKIPTTIAMVGLILATWS